ncbi:MAG: hypothetical protein WBB25_15560, partial [Sulfitobacter sp.]
MLRKMIVTGSLALLGACGDPLGGLDRISDVDLSENDPAAAALPTDAEVAREGFFGTSAASGEAGAVAPAGEAAPPSVRKGLLGLFGRAAPQDPVPEREAGAPEPDAEKDDVATAGLTPEPA